MEARDQEARFGNVRCIAAPGSDLGHGATPQAVNEHAIGCIEGRRGLKATVIDAFGVYSDPALSALMEKVTIGEAA
jgi:hypothetical protein